MKKRFKNKLLNKKKLKPKKSNNKYEMKIFKINGWLEKISIRKKLKNQIKPHNKQLKKLIIWINFLKVNGKNNKLNGIKNLKKRKKTRSKKKNHKI